MLTYFCSATQAVSALVPPLAAADWPERLLVPVHRISLSDPRWVKGGREPPTDPFACPIWQSQVNPFVVRTNFYVFVFLHFELIPNYYSFPSTDNYPGKQNHAFKSTEHTLTRYVFYIISCVKRSIVGVR